MRTLWVTTRSSNASTVWSLARSQPTCKIREFALGAVFLSLLCDSFYFCAISVVKIENRIYDSRGAGKLGKRIKKFISLTLYLPRFLTEHVNTASRPAGNVTFWIVPSNSGSASNPWRFMSAWREKMKTEINLKTPCRRWVQFDWQLAAVVNPQVVQTKNCAFSDFKILFKILATIVQL